MSLAEIGIIGGSGFYRFLDDSHEVQVDTPYGPPSGPLTVGTVAGRAVAFLPRHGPGHELAPHSINYRANLWALRSLGVTRVIGPCASGSLRADIVPGDLVVLDQLLDRTWGRLDTFVEQPTVDHVSFADPYCPELSGVLSSVALRPEGWPPGRVHQAGSVVVVQGPRFSTRAESRWYARAGIDLINMTQYPEAYLARELGICYSGLALVTDRDVGVEGDGGVPPVTIEAALAVLAEDVAHTRALLAAAIPDIPTTPGCTCRVSGAPSLRPNQA